MADADIHMSGKSVMAHFSIDAEFAAILDAREHAGKATWALGRHRGLGGTANAFAACLRVRV